MDEQVAELGNTTLSMKKIAFYMTYEGTICWERHKQVMVILIFLGAARDASKQ